jgi:hypothetical protein
MNFIPGVQTSHGITRCCLTGIRVCGLPDYSMGQHFGLAESENMMIVANCYMERWLPILWSQIRLFKHG